MLGSTVILHVSVRLLPASKSHCFDRVTLSDGMGTEIKGNLNNVKNYCNNCTNYTCVCRSNNTENFIGVLMILNLLCFKAKNSHILKYTHYEYFIVHVVSN